MRSVAEGSTTVDGMTSCLRFDVGFGLVVAGDFGDVTCVVCDVAFDAADGTVFARDVAFEVGGAAVEVCSCVVDFGDVVGCGGAVMPVGYVAL